MTLLIRPLTSSRRDWLGEKGENALAVTVAVPLTVVGGALVILGAWMATVEWRGRFAEATQTRGMEIKPGEIIAAIGNLRGAAIVLVVGAILMIGAAWIAQSAADNPTPETTTTGAASAPEPRHSAERPTLTQNPPGSG